MDGSSVAAGCLPAGRQGRFAKKTNPSTVCRRRVCFGWTKLKNFVDFLQGDTHKPDSVSLATCVVRYMIITLNCEMVRVLSRFNRDAFMLRHPSRLSRDYLKE